MLNTDDAWLICCNGLYKTRS